MTHSLFFQIEYEQLYSFFALAEINISPLTEKAANNNPKMQGYGLRRPESSDFVDCLKIFCISTQRYELQNHPDKIWPVKS
jgi:hypothetical protein